MIKWRFPSNDNGMNYGINDSGVTDFQSDPIKYLAREICQNSLDASRKNPTLIEFKCFQMKTDKIPGKEQLIDAFTRAKEYWKELKHDTKTKDFFEDALLDIQSEDCMVLRISDFNTKGLTGSRESLNTDFVNLIKSTGASDKSSGSGGSYGIGKYATFACSNYQTVFYSTLDYKYEEAYQGVAKLVTFERADGEKTQSTAFFGEEKNTPVYEQLKLDDDFNRNQNNFGTDIYILGFKQASENWKEDIIYSIMDNFLLSIWKGNLKVKVQDTMVSNSTLDTVISKYKNLFNKSHILNYYNLLKSNQTKWKNEDFVFANKNWGKIQFGILVNQENNSNKTLIARHTGMKIKENSRKSSIVPFTALFLIEDGVLNQELRKLENQKHTNWEYKRAKNPNHAKVLLKKLYEKIDELISHNTISDSIESIDAVGIGNYLPDLESGENKGDSTESISNRVQDIIIKDVSSRLQLSKSKKETKKKAKRNSKYKELENKEITFDAVGNEVTATNQGKFSEHIIKNDNHMDSNPISVKDSEKKMKLHKKVNLEAENVRFITLDKNTGKYILSFMPTNNKKYTNGVIEIFLSGEVGKYEAVIKSCNLIQGNAKVEGNKIKNVVLEKNKQVRIMIEIDFDDYCALEADVYAIEE